MATIETIEIEIKKNSNNAVDGVEKLTKSLSALKNVIKGSLGLTSSINQIKKLKNSLDDISGSFDGVSNTFEALQAMSRLDFSNLAQAAQSVREIGNRRIRTTAAAPTATNDESGAQDGGLSDGEVQQEAGHVSEEARTSVIDFKKFGEGLSKYVIGTARAATAPLRSLGKQFKNLTKSIGRIAIYRAVRSAIKGISSATKEGVQNLVQYSAALNSTDAASANQTMSEYASTLQQVKNSVGTAVMPVLAALLPIVNSIASAFITAANAVNQFLQALGGKSTFIKAKKNTVDYAKSVNSASGAVKELQKTILGFDEINKLSDESSSSGGGASGIDYSDMFEEAEVDSKIKKIAKWTNEIVGEISAFLNSAIGILTTSLGLFVMGAILTFSGANIPLGLGLMVAGGVLFAKEIATKWDELSDEIKNSILSIMVYVGSAVLVIGVLLAFSGANIPLGIGLIVSGAGILGTAVALDWGKIKKLLNGQLGAIIATLSTALLAIGAVLAFTGASIPLGIGLMVVGAAGLATVVVVNWDTIVSKVSEVLSSITSLVVSIGLLAVGLVLAFTGVALGIGIGMIAVGAIGIASYAYLNWDTIKQKLQKCWEDIKRIAKSVGMIALGALLCFTGAGIALGLGMMIEGGASLAQSREANWNSVLTYLQSAWNSISNWWNTSVQPIIDKWTSTIANIFSGGNSVSTTATTRGTGFTKKTGFGSTALAKAGGGFVSSGELFVAREAGPELVGSIGGQTAVANNDQIVTAVSAGVAQAVASVLGGQSSSNDIHVYLDSKEISAGLNRRNRMYGTALAGV